MNWLTSRLTARAQAILEFALALPILLVLLFGIFEFGRLTQAWLAVQNSARFGVRYAATGEFDVQYCSVAAFALGYEAADAFGTSPPTYDCRVQTAYCESLPFPQNETCDAEQMTAELIDWARLPSIRDAALDGVAGAAVNLNTIVSGDYLSYLLNHDATFLGNSSQVGYYHVMVCSNRDANQDHQPDFYRDETVFPQTCVEWRANPHALMDDAGDAGNRVRVTVTYVHPMVLPFVSNLWPSVPLSAWREGIVEQFRTSRISGVGSAIGAVPTDTPTPTITLTPTNTNTPLPSPTFTSSPTPTDTPTPTNSPTPTATPTPSCDNLVVNGPLYFSGDDILVPLGNTNPLWPIDIGLVNTTWDELEGQAGGPWHDQVTTLPADNHLDFYTWAGTTVYDVSPNEYLDRAGIVFGHNLAFAILASQSSNLGLDFSRSFTASPTYYHARDFSVAINYTIGELVCPPRLITGRYGPIVTVTSPLPNPITEPFTVQASTSDPDGSINRVRFEVWNQTETTRLGYYEDTAAPYCLFGDAGGVCITRGLGYNWPGGSVTIENGTFVIYIQAQDNDTPNQFTRIRRVITLNLPALVPCNNNGNGLLGEYFTWTGVSPPSFGSITNLVYARIDPVVNFNWGTGAPAPGVPADRFAVRWTGFVQPKYDQVEAYMFYALTDDGVRLWVDGQLLVNRWQDQSATEGSGVINLPAGCPLIPIQIEYYENITTATAQLRWESAFTNKQIIPVVNLYAPAGPLPATSTPLPTATATNTSIPTNTPLPTNTQSAATPTVASPTVPIPTSTEVVLITPTPTSSNPTQTPVPTSSRTPTTTPTPCLTPPDLGGCR